MPFRFRPATERGRLDDPGLTGVAAFSHGSAFDPGWLGFGALRVLNRVEIAAGQCLPPARRANMELLSLVLAGRYRAHSQAGDSGVLEAGQICRLAAGAGVDLVEANADPARPLRLLQLWLQPRHSNARPQQETARVPAEAACLAAPEGTRAALLPWQADAVVQRLRLAPGGSLALPPTVDAACWIEVIEGEAALGGCLLRAGDGVGIGGEDSVALVSSFGADLLRIDLPALPAPRGAR